MSATTLQPLIVSAYEEAQKELRSFHAAVDKNNPDGAASALQRAAQAICNVLTKVVDDTEFWAETADLLRDRRLTSDALEKVLADLEKTAEQEGNILRSGGYSSESVASLLGTFENTLGAFREFPSGNTLEPVRQKVDHAQRAICELAKKPVVVRRSSFWGRPFRTVKNSLKILGGVGVIVGDVAGTVALVHLAPLAFGVAAASVGSGFGTILEVGGDDIGGVSRRR